MRTLIAIPVHNEEKHVRSVLDAVLTYAGNVLIVDDGSTDGTPDILKHYPVDVIRHAENRGYGRSIRDAFTWAQADGFDWLITMDCDNQHEPQAIPEFIEAAARDDADVISASRYLRTPEYATAQINRPAVGFGGDNAASARPASLPVPADRRAINGEVTDEINRVIGRALGTPLTDSFCGFKAYRVAALRELHLTEDGYAMPMQFWVQAAAHGLRIREIPVALIYNDATRTFGGPLDNPDVRLRHYREVFNRELHRCQDLLPNDTLALAGLQTRCCCGR